MTDRAAQIAQAKQAGYSDAEIIGFLGKSDPQVQQAKSAGYGDSEIVGYLTKGAQAATKAAPKPASMSPMSQITGAMANFNRGTGIGDELVGAAKTAGNLLSGQTKWQPGVGNMLGAIGNDFRSNMGQQRQVEDNYTAQHPMAAALSRGTGMAATAAVPAGKTAQAVAAAPRAMNMLGGATTAALNAYGYGLADRGTMKERVQTANASAFNPVTLGLGALGGALMPAAQGPKMVKPKVPSLDELQTAKNAAYAAVDASGAKYSPQAVDGMVQDITKAATDANINPARHPKAASMLEDIQALAGQPLSLTQVDQLRQVIRRDVADSTDAAERFFGKKMIGKLDEFVNSADASKMIGGDAQGAADLINTARDLNTRYRKVDTVQSTVESARLRAGSTGSGGNIDNAIRQNLRRVLEKTPNLTADESQALETIVMGSKGQNFLRQVGKLSPQGNGLMTALSIGGTMANPALGVPTMLGAGSKVAADAITQGRVKDLISLMAVGGDKASLAKQQLAQIARNPQLDATLRQALLKLSRVEGAAGESTVAPRGSVSVQIEGRPDLGTGVSQR